MHPLRPSWGHHHGWLRGKGQGGAGSKVFMGRGRRQGGESTPHFRSRSSDCTSAPCHSYAQWGAGCPGGHGLGAEPAARHRGATEDLRPPLPSAWNASQGPTSPLSPQKPLHLCEQWDLIFNSNVFLSSCTYTPPPSAPQSPIKIVTHNMTCTGSVLGR